MQAAAPALGVLDASVDFAVDAHMQALKRADPRGGDLQQGAGLDHHEDVAEGVVRRRAVDEGHILTEPVELGLGEDAHAS